MPPRTTSTSVRPSPIATASTTLCSGWFFAAKASARANTMQLVVMSGMKMPSTRYSGCTNAFIARSITVTRAAMMSTNTGMRISFGTKLRTPDTAPLEAAITSVVATPSDSALTTLLLIASSGHRPSSCTSPVFCLMRPL